VRRKCGRNSQPHAISVKKHDEDSGALREERKSWGGFQYVEKSLPSSYSMNTAQRGLVLGGAAKSEQQKGKGNLKKNAEQEEPREGSISKRESVILKRGGGAGNHSGLILRENKKRVIIGDLQKKKSELEEDPWARQKAKRKKILKRALTQGRKERARFSGNKNKKLGKETRGAWER